MTLIERITTHKIITIIRGIHGESLSKTVQALYAGGIRLVEITFDSTEAISPQITAAEIQALSTSFAGKMDIGAGTVLTPTQVQLAADSGAAFIVSPNVDERIIRLTKKLGCVSIPGAMTPTEAVAAHGFGADFVKLFPAGVLGTSYMKAFCAPLSHIKMLAFGGVDENTVTDFLQAGFCGVGIGSGLTPTDAIENGDFEKVTRIAEKFVRSARSCGDHI